MKELFKIYFSFFKMGAVTFGGGYAMLPILKSEAVEKHHWVDEEQVIDFYALSQSLPGIISINVALFIGYQQRKTYGAISAAIGVITPSIIVITIIAMFLDNFSDNTYIQSALNGITICVGALILDSVIIMLKKGVKDRIGVMIFLSIFLLSVLTDISAIYLVISAAIIGVIYKGLVFKGDSK